MTTQTYARDFTSLYAQYTRVDWGPLTTTFTPPPDCFQLERDEYNYGWKCELSTDSYLSRMTGYLEYNPRCFPPTQTTPRTVSTGTGSVTVYTPANACPEGFTTACQITRGAQVTPELQDPTQWPMFRLLKYGETAYGCCLSGYACALDPAICVTSTPLTTTGPYLVYDSTCGVSTASSPVPAQSTQARFLLITSQPLDNVPGSNSLAFGAEIGIAIGVSLATILFALGCCFLGRKTILKRPATRGVQAEYKAVADGPLPERGRERSSPSLDEGRNGRSRDISPLPRISPVSSLSSVSPASSSVSLRRRPGED